MNTDIAFAQPAVKGALCIATSVVSCASRVWQRFICLNDDREIQLDVLSGYTFDGREQAVAIWSVADRARRYTPKANLVEEVEFAIWLEARVEEMR
jgi:hypothetical protein